MKVYDLKIRTKKDYIFTSVIEAKNYDNAKEKVNEILNSNSFVGCLTEDEESVFVAVSEISFLIIKNNGKESE